MMDFGRTKMVREQKAREKKGGRKGKLISFPLLSLIALAPFFARTKHASRKQNPRDSNETHHRKGAWCAGYSTRSARAYQLESGFSDI